MPGYADKIISRPDLLRQAAAWRAAGETIALVNGCFDILHAGHIRFLQAAAATAGRLVVAVNSDASVRCLKGEGRPILPEQARAQLVAAVRGVDAVTVFEESTVEPLLRALRPNVHAKGTDYTETSVPEAGVARELGIAVRIVGDPKSHSTSALLQRLRRFGDTEG
ncbi:MAG: adenylyltransferase/cytidyltransferase family protein [Terriglobales bacterium]